MTKSVKKKLLLPFLLSSAICAVAGLNAAVIAAHAEETPQVGQHILEMTDINGEKKSLPAWYDGSKYLLADYTRNIFVHNGFEATSLNDISANIDRFPIYTSATGEFTDGIAVSLYANIITAYDFYSEENIGEDHFGLKGQNDDRAENWTSNPSEVPLHAVVHFNTGPYRFNATCYAEGNTGFLVTGDGDASNTEYDMYRQAACLDVIAHEYQHGIARFLNKGLTYMNDSGAMDEAFADVFAMLVSGEDMTSEDFWKIGESCTISGIAQRRIDFPSKSKDYRYRTTVASKYVCSSHYSGGHGTTCDNNYVHHNSTIVSHVQYTAWELCPEVFTRENVGKLWFNTLKLLEPNATFKDFSDAIRKTAAEKLNSTAVNAIDYSLYVNGFIKDVMHKVTFVDENGEVLFQTAVPHGSTLDEFRPEPTDSEFYDYVFSGWEGAEGFITEDVTVRAVVEKVPKKFSVRFMQDDGTLYEEKMLPYGSALEFPAVNPTKESDKEFDYKFVGWSGTEDNVTGEMLLTAQYEATPIEKKFPLGLILGITLGVGAVIAAVVVIVVVKKKKQ